MRNILFVLVFILIIFTTIVVAGRAYLYRDADIQYVWQDNTRNMRHQQAGYYALSKFLSQHIAPKKVLYISNMKKFNQYRQKEKNALLLMGEAQNGYQSLSKRHIDSLLQWVEEGNHLLIKENQYINQKLGIKFNNFPVKKQVNKNIQAACTQEYNTLKQQYIDKFPKFLPSDFIAHCSSNLSIFRLPENKQDIFLLETPIEELKHIGGFDIRQTPNIISVAYTADNIPTIVRVKKGQGSITVVGTYEIFAHPERPTKSRAIHLNRFDNAYFAAYLAQEKSVVYLMSPPQQPAPKIALPLWVQWFKEQPLLSTLFVLLIVACVWQYARRLGGKRRYDTRQERQQMAHFAAQGRLITHQNEQYATLCEWQKERLQLWQRKLGQFSHTGKRQTAVLIAKQIGVRPDEVALWLEPIPQNLRGRDLLRYIRSHQQLRKQQK